MPKDGQTDTEKLIEEQKKREEDIKTTIYHDATSALMSFASVLPAEKSRDLQNSRLYDEVNGVESYDDEDMMPLAERAIEVSGISSPKCLDAFGSEKNVNKLLDQNALNAYKGKLSQMADRLDVLIDNNIGDDEIGKKSKEFIKSVSSDNMRRTAEGLSNTYLGYKNILGAGLSSMYPVVNVSTEDQRLQNNIRKWQYKFPIHQLMIDGEKQLKTMSDYWMEKEKNDGSLLPEREQEYRQKLYDQTVTMSALYNKMISACENKKMNAAIHADGMLGNDAFHLHPRTHRGTTPLNSGLQAMKTGLENGWAIEDIGKLAAFHNLMYREKNRATCNGAIELDKFEEYDPPRYESEKQKAYVQRLEEAWKHVEDVKLASADDRSKILTDLDNLVKEGVKDGYLKEKQAGVACYNQVASQGAAREQAVASGREPAFHDQAHNVKIGEDRRLEAVFADMNAERTDLHFRSESVEHKNMRVAMEELQDYMRKNPNKGKTKEEIADYSARYLEKLEAVKKTSDIYKEKSQGAKTVGGRNRLRGAESASAFAGMEMDTVMQRLKSAGVSPEEETMETFQIRMSAKQVGFKETIREQTKNIDGLIDDLKKVDKWTSSPNFKNLKNGLRELQQFSEKINQSGKELTRNDLEQYRELVDNVGKLADTYLDNKKDVNSDYAKSRVAAVRKLKENIHSVGEAFKDAPEQYQKQKEQEIFGDRYKLYDQMDCVISENAAVFWGEKYKDSEMRSKGGGSYSLTRSAGVSVSVFALANTGKYSFEDIMDPSKLQAEKAEMFDRVATAMRNPTPESQKWIAQTIYEGQKTTERMIDEQAKQLDFSKADISRDKTFCQMLHMSHIQFDAWQEMAHCQDEIMELAKKEHPEMKQYNDYKEWWAGRQGVLGTLNTNISGIREQIVSGLTNPKASVAGKLLQDSLSEKLLMNDLSRMQQEKKDVPFSEWVTPEKSQEYFVTTNMCGVAAKAQVDYMFQHPDDAALLFAKFADGSFVKNATINVDMSKGKVTVNGLPGVSQMKEMAQNEQFLKKTDAALGRLEKGQYQNKESFIEDAAYAMIGQMYRMSGGKLPKNKDGGSVSLEEYKNQQVGSRIFLDSLKSQENPEKFISPKKVAETAKDRDKLQNMARNHTVQKKAPARTTTAVQKKEKGGFKK